MKKSVFRQLYANDGDVTVIGKVVANEPEITRIEEPEIVVEEKKEKKEVKKKNGRKFTI